jgi:hypothetical protein
LLTSHVRNCNLHLWRGIKTVECLNITVKRKEKQVTFEVLEAMKIYSLVFVMTS